ncbi:hypothetical protein AAHH17_08705 [Lysinibacillus capsici]|uniref:hypothetical protein n=1 Tax=Lysinibacillus TaxID=400634 RepID=UPI00247FD057|nr:hypothetical protein [Lysinibacillus sp. 1 U-2021]WGT38953.1 hypothetical protein QH639_24755 [Lysinibacillus sp. 1 U-2021]
MKKNIVVLFLGIFMLTSIILPINNTASAASDTLDIGIYVDGKFHTKISDFKKMKTADKAKLLMTNGAYLSLGKQLVETKNIFTMNNEQLENSKISVAEYLGIIGGGQTSEFKVLSID